MKRTCGIPRLLALLLTLALLTGCASGVSAASSSVPAEEAYPVPEFRDARFHPENAVTPVSGFQLDESAMAQGYLAMKAQSENTLKFQISLGDMTYTYTVPGDNSETILPLNMGSGSYTLRLLENIGDDKYAGLWTDTCQVTLEDEFEPFLRPSQMVKYSADSQCVALAKELAASCRTDAEIAAAIYQYVVKHIRYDKQKAADVQPGYLPDPDETLDSGKGICFDYASLTAAMLRSVGIPCKLITGYVDGSLYHAWNMFYLEDSGWVTAKIEVSADIWNRVDLTFAAGGTGDAELKDDGRYTTRYTY